MKNLKKPTYIQKKRISKAGIDPTKVYVKSDNVGSIVVLERETNRIIEITGKRYKVIETGES